MSKEKLHIKRWETICSDVGHLFFVSITTIKWDTVFTVKDSTYSYEFTFEGGCPYMVFDEAFRSEHVERTGRVGWTFIYEDSDFIKLFNPGIIDVHFAPELPTHYAIFCEDGSLEILSSKEPIIRKCLIEK